MSYLATYLLRWMTSGILAIVQEHRIVMKQTRAAVDAVLDVLSLQHERAASLEWPT